MSWSRFRASKKGQEKKAGNTHSLCAEGHSHRSKLESAVCQILHLRQKAGELNVVQVEDHIYLTRARIGYIPDFKCLNLNTNEYFWVEAKGYENDRWPMKKKLWKFYGPGRLEVWKGSYMKPYLDEVITPQTRIEPENTNEK